MLTEQRYEVILKLLEEKNSSFVNFMGQYPFHFVRKSVIIQKVTSILTFILTKNQRIFQKKCEN